MDTTVRAQLTDLLSPLSVAMGTFGDASAFADDAEDPLAGTLERDAQHFRVMSARQYEQTRAMLLAGLPVPVMQQPGDAFCDVAGRAFALGDLDALKRAIRGGHAEFKLRDHTLDAANVALDIYSAALRATISNFLDESTGAADSALVSSIEGEADLDSIAVDIGLNLTETRDLIVGKFEPDLAVVTPGDSVCLTVDGRQAAARLLHAHS